MSVLGAKRRRGLGSCRLRVAEVAGLEDVIAWAGGGHPAELPAEAPVGPGQEEPEAGDGQWLRVSLRLELKTPLVVHRRTIGNVQLSADRVPGWMLLPMAVAALRPGVPGVDSAARAGRLLVTDATPEIGGAPARRVPSALAQEKGTAPLAERTWNRFAELADIQVKALRAGYIGGEEPGHLPRWVGTDRAITTHNVIDDELGRPSSAVGGVYSVEALTVGGRARPPGVFRAELRVRAGVVASAGEKWWQVLDGARWVGRKARGDYGQVEVEAKLLPAGAAVAESAEPVTELRVWLLSEALVRDARLRQSTSPDDFGRALASALGVPPETVRLRQDVGDGLLNWLGAAERAESWQRSWGLPRTSLVGIAAGSCGVFELDEPVSPAQMAEVELAGVGERRAEGFGQVRINDNLLNGRLSHLTASGPLPDQDRAVTLVPPEDPSFPMARGLERVAWLSEVAQRAEELAADPGARERATGITSAVPGAQLGSLRAVVGRLGPDEGPPTLRHWVEATSAMPKRRESWARPSPPSGHCSTTATSSGSVWAWWAVSSASWWQRRGRLRPCTATCGGRR